MKPPWRPRLLPARFAPAPPSPERPRPGPWGLREKRALLAELRLQARRGLPERRLPAALRERLPRRSEEEVGEGGGRGEGEGMGPEIPEELGPFGIPAFPRGSLVETPKSAL